TLWERWDSMLPDGTVNPGEMTSFNHFWLGSIGDWMHRTVAGLAPAAPGYRELTVHPVPHPALTHASARHLTPYGEASVTCRRHDGRFELQIVVPVGVRAHVHLPGQDPFTVRHGRHTWTTEDPCENATKPVHSIGDLIDTRDLWSAAVDVLVAHGLGHDAT